MRTNLYLRIVLFISICLMGYMTSACSEAPQPTQPVTHMDKWYAKETPGYEYTPDDMAELRERNRRALAKAALNRTKIKLVYPVSTRFEDLEDRVDCLASQDYDRNC